VTARRFRVFRRTWWANKACTIPHTGRKFHVGYFATEAEARAECDTRGRMAYGATKRGPRGAAYEYESV
jgi:hypothetical protein